MRIDEELTDSGRKYAAAYAAHYTGPDLPLALQLYKKLLASYPNAPEAAYARMQVQNIVNAVVPKQHVLDAQIKMLLSYLEHDGFEHDVPLDAERSHGMPFASDLSI